MNHIRSKQHAGSAYLLSNGNSSNSSPSVHNAVSLSANLSRSRSSSQDYKRNKSGLVHNEGFATPHYHPSDNTTQTRTVSTSDHATLSTSQTDSPNNVIRTGLNASPTEIVAHRSLKDSSLSVSLPNWQRSAGHWLSASGRFGSMSIFSAYSMLNSSFGNLSISPLNYKPEFDQFHLLKIAPIDFANQITLIDIRLFLNIKQEEILAFGWNTPRKAILAPNITAYNRRFNQICFWAINEILLSNIKHAHVITKATSNTHTPTQLSDAESIKCRAEVLTHFIKIAKKLYLLNNIQSCYAITSALHSSSIYRLTKTWNQIAKKEKKSFEELSRLFSEENNFENLRHHIKTIKGSCIPYLGMYFKDLIYIDTAFPKDKKKNNSVNFQRELKIRECVQQIMDSYTSTNYENITPIPAVRTYLQSINYIEELQKFMEEDYYKLSLKLEPPESKLSKSAKAVYDNKNVSMSNNHSTFYVNQSNHASDDSLIDHHRNQFKSNAIVAQGSVSSSNGTTSSSQTKQQSQQFVPSHRKSLSLGANSNLINPRLFLTESFRRPDIKYDKRYIVDDSLVEEDFECDQLCPDNPEISKISTHNANVCDSLSTNSAIVFDESGVGEDQLPSSTSLSICDIRFQEEEEEEESSQLSFQPNPIHHQQHHQQHHPQHSPHLNHHQLHTSPLHPSHHHHHHQPHLFNSHLHHLNQSNTLHRSFFSTESSSSPVDQHHFIPRSHFLITNNIINQGYIKRKTILKDGKKPTLSTWIRYWLVLNATSLIFYSSKSLRGCYRSHFKSQPSKFQSLRSSLINVKLDDESYQMDVFILTDASCNNVYKFRTNTQLEAITWCREISNVLIKNN